MHFMDPLDRLSLMSGRFEPVLYVNAPDHKDVSVKLDLAGGLRSVLIIAGVDLARFQRASECPRESTRGRGHDVIQRRGMRRIIVRGDLVMLGDLGMDAKDDRFLLRW
jgi:hypothetical protein